MSGGGNDNSQISGFGEVLRGRNGNSVNWETEGDAGWGEKQKRLQVGSTSEPLEKDQV